MPPWWTRRGLTGPRSMGLLDDRSYSCAHAALAHRRARARHRTLWGGAGVRGGRGQARGGVRSRQTLRFARSTATPCLGASRRHRRSSSCVGRGSRVRPRPLSTPLGRAPHGHTFTPSSARRSAISPLIAATNASSGIAPASFSTPRTRRETVLASASRGPTMRR